MKKNSFWKIGLVIFGIMAMLMCGCGGDDNPSSGGNPSGEDPSGGNPSGGNPSDGEPSGGNPSGGDPSGGNPPDGDPPQITYNVIFNTNGGEPVPASQTIISGGKVTQPQTITKVRYIFDGWYKEESLINQWNFSTDTVSSNVTLYAKWKQLEPLYVKQISSGGSHTVVIGTDGSLWAWGSNQYGDLGDGTTIGKNTPTKIGTDINWKSVSAGNNYTVAIKTDGSLWAWGLNNNGQLGDGQINNSKTNYGYLYKDTPTRIGAETNWESVSAGYNHTVAIKTDGSLWKWGSELTPTRVGADNDWVSISAGNLYTQATKTDGSLWAWGSNQLGKLGDGTTVLSRNAPTRIGTETNWKSVSAGSMHTMAIKTDGSLWGWGNMYYKPVDGTGTGVTIPTQIGTDNNWVFVFAGDNHTIAIKTDGSLWAWGKNDFGQLGDGTTIEISTPTRIGTDINWKSVSGGDSGAGWFYTTAIKTDGSLWVWGDNRAEQLGDGTTTSRRTPTQILIYE